MNYVVDSYENYKEENRLTTNNARRIEFVTTTRVLDEIIDTKSKILDCAAGTGIYAFWFADKGHDVTATDITPRHIDIINRTLTNKNYHMNTSVLDATDMSCFADDLFDIVLNMGPFYHLITEEQREKCMKECLRVLRKGGLLVTAYIPRYYVFQYIATSNEKYLDEHLAKQLIETGVLKHDDEKCFWTDTYYSSKDEMESIYRRYGLKIVDHFAQDGLAPLLSQKVDKWDENQFKTWCDYHYSVCREQSVLGASNHVIIIGRKLLDFERYNQNQRQEIVEDTFHKAILKQGKCDACYLDNGTQYTTNQLHTALARLGIRVLHAKPRACQSKGKIEKFHQKVDRFIAEVRVAKVHSLEELNQKWKCFLEQDYQKEAHDGIYEYYESHGVKVPAEGISPMREFNRDTRGLIFLDATVVSEAFLHHETRKLDNAGFFSFGDVKYEASTALANAEVEIAYDPMNTETIKVVYQDMKPIMAHREIGRAHV